MYKLALKMLIEDRAKFIGMVVSLAFSALIITQQAAIFIGIMMRTFGTIVDTPQADIWVANPKVLMIDDIKPLRETDLYRVRGVEGVSWAVPFFKGAIRARLSNGTFQTCIVIGIDSNTFIGAPHKMLEGTVQDLRMSDAVIVNKVGAETKLAFDRGPDLPAIPLKVGDVFELNDQRARVVGICETTRTFGSQPVIYTTYNRAIQYSPAERKLMSFILVKAQARFTPKELCEKITHTTGLAAYTAQEFKNKTILYYLKNTGIPINFGLAVLLGLLIGAAIAGQIFYNFITDNLKYLTLFKIMGADNVLLAKMTFLQALWVAFLGWGIGSGCAGLIGLLSRKTELAFHLPWQLFLGVGLIILLICFCAALISIVKIFKTEPATIFKR